MEISYKIILIGDSSVGKSSLINQWVYKKVEENLKPTIAVEFSTKPIIINDEKIKAQIWDTAGQEKYRSIVTKHYRKAQGAIIVYDITNKESFLSIDHWEKELLLQADPSLKIRLVGNKLDLVENSPHLRQVSIEEAREYAERHNMPWVELSAYEYSNTDKVFFNLIEDIHSLSGNYKPLNGEAKFEVENNKITSKEPTSKPEEHTEPFKLSPQPPSPSPSNSGCKC